VVVYGVVVYGEVAYGVVVYGEVAYGVVVYGVAAYEGYAENPGAERRVTEATRGAVAKGA